MMFSHLFAIWPCYRNNVWNPLRRSFVELDVNGSFLPHYVISRCSLPVESLVHKLPIILKYQLSQAQVHLH